MKSAQGSYDHNSLWWRMERLSMLIGIDEERFGAEPRRAMRALEARIIEKTALVEAEACALMQSGHRSEAVAALSALTAWAVDEAMNLAYSLAEGIAASIRQSGGLYGARQGLTPWILDCTP